MDRLTTEFVMLGDYQEWRVLLCLMQAKLVDHSLLPNVGMVENCGEATREMSQKMS